MGLVLSIIGAILLAATLCGVAFGLFMAAGRKTREAGKYFALWWIPGVAAAFGVVLKDPVTFVVGLVCFVIAGAIFVLVARRGRSESLKRSAERRSQWSAERTTIENQRRGNPKSRRAS